MACDECRRLHEEETHAWQSLQNHRAMNVQMSRGGRETKKVDRRLTQAYDLACANSRLHKGKDHRNEGHTINIEDLNTFIRDGRTRP